MDGEGVEDAVGDVVQLISTQKYLVGITSNRPEAGGNLEQRRHLGAEEAEEEAGVQEVAEAAGVDGRRPRWSMTIIATKKKIILV